MDSATRENIYLAAKKWILEAGKQIRENIDKPIEVGSKTNPNDLVTSMDKNTEKYFLEKIKTNYPNHFLLSEEGFGDVLHTLDGIVWIIDPIDGTMNFVQQKRNFAISIGIYHDGIGEIGLIYNVMEDVLYHAKRGEGAYKDEYKLPPLNTNMVLEESVIGLNHLWLCENKLVDEKYMQKLIKTARGSRTYGSAALELAFVAEGILEGYLTMGLSPWDFAAGMILIEEVGGITTNIDGGSIDMLQRNSVFAGNPTVHKQIITNFLSKGRK
ncbi:inositol monophosphatase family protein [Ornithinibacillus halotolerans]|uniref:inositol-phosphate phosphatase n=1 Tax=Ornithinibacillus halotolerans TaxID=1274357 RepID=A0A916S6U1_9BACI|nr:inositol monophosphatase family protein [Ornithinibacillus halotolerans]GGA83554.1 inositol-1-monophosphatase [Ornithinibacillus halotolerans]